MKKAYVKPIIASFEVKAEDILLHTSRFQSTNGEDYENVLEDRDGDEEPTPKAKFNDWNLWED